jgi:hypothetical protein
MKQEEGQTLEEHEKSCDFCKAMNEMAEERIKLRVK